ncbi:hypothetical protein [Bowmanella yangjiangensis]|uniref:DUF1795 domain-containing protein n=1 Tax=Bowmanella yangjiangensis TaxID=2811230 RepID=A0ABS3CNJ3_9ALTE|nr:hypothetical protein [Bowmanella yangjiangensis]MBN7818676.1 hypothetical protein [Bowmanella yangjiangensis]
MESQLVLSSIWEDDSLFEVRISGSNSVFAGRADCYTNREEIEQLGKILEKFPTSVKDEFEFKSRSRPDLSYFSISGLCTDRSGHTLLLITIAHIESFTNSRNESYKVNFDLKVEPQAINLFGKQLQRIAVEPLAESEAVLKSAI